MCILSTKSFTLCTCVRSTETTTFRSCHTRNVVFSSWKTYLLEMLRRGNLVTQWMRQNTCLNKEFLKSSVIHKWVYASLSMRLLFSSTFYRRVYYSLYVLSTRLLFSLRSIDVPTLLPTFYRRAHSSFYGLSIPI